MTITALPVDWLSLSIFFVARLAAFHPLAKLLTTTTINRLELENRWEDQEERESGPDCWSESSGGGGGLGNGCNWPSSFCVMCLHRCC